MNKPKLLIGIETLFSGGAESFVVRLANSLSDNYDVSLFVVFGDKIDERLLRRQGNRFKLLKFQIPLDFFVKKIDGFLLKFSIDFSLRNILVINKLKRLIIREKFKILHSNQFKVDLVFYLANLHLRIPHITTIHGDYIAFNIQEKVGQLRIINYGSKVNNVLNGLNGIVYISDHQLTFLKKEWNLVGLESRSRKIYNGIELPSEEKSLKGGNKKSFVFGMVARGIPEKGWELAIQAFINLNISDCMLMLFGESKYLDELAAKYKFDNIVFGGYTADPLECIKHFDVGLLPSTFASESLPTTVIEYMAMGKPVIATDIGEIKNMLCQGGRISGTLLPIEDGIVNPSLLTKAMRELKTDPELHLLYSLNARNNAKSFDINICSMSYSDFYMYAANSGKGK